MTQDQLDRLDVCYCRFCLDEICEEEVVPARSLLGPSRFDLYAILLYIDSKVRGLSNNKYHEDVYCARTGAITGDRYVEIGKSHKTSFEAYRDDLDKLINAHLAGEYDENRTYIPVDKDYVLLDGAHRVACAAYFNKQVPILRFLNREAGRVDYKSLGNRLLHVTASDAMALEASKWHENLFMLLFWPVANNNKEALERSMQLVREKMAILYERQMPLSSIAIRNLMLQLYGHMDWLGSVDDGFKGLNSKVEAVWSPEGICRFFLVCADSVEDVLKLKAEIRAIYDIGLSPIHSTDTIQETRLAVNALFNPNSFHFLSYGKPEKYKASYNLFKQFKSTLVTNGLTIDEYIIDSGMSLAIYGVRESLDLDYLCENPKQIQDVFEISGKDKEFDYHGAFLHYYNLSIQDLLYNPLNYFSFDGVKFVALPSLSVFKKNRYKEKKAPKDKNDLRLIESLLGNALTRDFKIWLNTCLWSIRRRVRVFRRNVSKLRNDFLKKLGVYDSLRRIVRGSKG